MPSLTPLFTRFAYKLPDVVGVVETRLQALEAKMNCMRPESDGYKSDELMRNTLRGGFNTLQDWIRQGFAIVVTDKVLSDSNPEHWLGSLRPAHSAVEATSIGAGRQPSLRNAPGVSLHLVGS